MDSSPVLEFAAAANEPADMLRLDSFSTFCVTIYNERLNDLQDTIRSIANAVAYEASLTDTCRKPTCISLIMDGLLSADPEAIHWLTYSGLLSTQIPHEMGEYELYVSRRSFDELIGHLPTGATVDHHPLRPDFIIVACLKRQNKGKLDSHALFFNDVCRLTQPTFCFQIDVGTIVHKESYHRLLQQMDRERDLGALAPCIVTPSPIAANSLFLSTWQHVDFVRQKAVHWPLEVAAGHLSVIPGQFCAFRWVALCRAPPDLHGRQDGEASPLEAYIRGLVTEGPLEKLMYLAEDRVIGNEIVLTKNSDWRLGYSLDAVATTDACHSITELMRQRRRWNNSALACRIWLLGKTLDFLTRTDRTAVRKAKFARAMIFQVAMQLVELATPATTVAIALSLYRTFQSIHTPVQSILFALLWFAAATTAAAALLSNRRFLGAGSNQLKFAIVAIPAFIFSVSLGLFWSVTLPPAALPLILAPAIFRVVSMMPVFGKNVFRLVLLDNIYVLANLFIGPLLSVYSMLNIHDVSWGTKGLTSARESAAFRTRMLRMKALIVGAWILFNALLVGVAVYVPGFTSPKLNPLFELLCVGSCVTALFSLATLYASRLKRASPSLLTRRFARRALLE